MLSRYHILPFLALFAFTANAAERPNIIIIMSDDMGYSDIGCYGGEINTPHLDSLAQEGVRFTQFYNTSRCCPTRASLLTGLYPHQTGVGHMMEDYGLPTYQGDLNQNCLTIAEALKPAGYRSYLSGKWHVTPYHHAEENPPKENWPLQRGFDEFFGTIHGAGSLFDPCGLTRGNEYITPENDPQYTPEGSWYYTNAITDNAVKFITDHAENHSTQPFFTYVPYTAAHWPMHALPEDIAKYDGAYDDGYTAIRQTRVKRLKELKLLPDDWEVSPQVGDWSSVKNKEWESALMEVYAAMVDCMDRGIGKIVESLKSTGQYENTMIIFLQDNGGCAETFGRKQRVGPLERPPAPTLPPMSKDELQTEMIPPQSRDGYPLRRGEGVMPGPPETEIGYGENWANVSNTPFKEYKHYSHEGGISSPLIIHWPNGVSGKGEAYRTTPEGPLYDSPAHLVDIMATALDYAGTNYPTYHNGYKLTPLEGISLRPAIEGKPLERGKPLFFEHEGNRAIRDGKWKLVSKYPTGKWELYDMEQDRTEMYDLSLKERNRAAYMMYQWEQWAHERGVVPFRSWYLNPEAKK
jgi:arylsulfatase A-like enzyme